MVDPSVEDVDVPIEQLSEEPPEAAVRAPPQEPAGVTGDAAELSALDVVLDPGGDVPRTPASPRTKGGLSPSMTAVLGTLFGLATFGGVLVLLIGLGPAHTRTPPPAPSATAVESADGAGEPGPAPSGSAAPGPSGSVAPPPAPIPGPWRISAFEGNADVKLVDGTVERRSFLDALTGAGVPKAQVYRIMKAFAGIRKFDKTKRRDTFVVAIDRASRKVKAFEYQVSATEIYQAREKDDGLLAGEKLDLHVDKRRVSAAVTIGDDLATACRAAGLDDDILETLDDALEGRMQLSGLHPGATLRIVADEETALGVFARYDDIEAVEYRAAGSDSALRVYHFHGKKVTGYFDAKGHQPYKGGWRTPIPFAKVSSRFNMHRMHPILHVVMPHNGVDFGAPSGTPVYAASFGTVAAAGPAGPSGNLVLIDHPGSLTTGYAHLSRFAPGLHAGQKVETRQLIGYVGTTGRSTGPHLHFSVKKNGVFVDPLTLKLDGERVLPKGDREAFDALRDALDKAIDAIPLPTAPAAEPPAVADADAGEPQELELEEQPDK